MSSGNLAKSLAEPSLGGPSDEQRPKPRRLLVSLPALNEERTLPEVIARIPRDIPGIDEVLVLVVDDGSSDQSAELARAAGAKVLSHSHTQGVGAAFQSALRWAIEEGVDYVVTIDSDGQFNPADIPKLAAPVVAGKAEFATASRFKDPALVPQMPGLKLWGNRMMSRLISGLAGGRYFDVSCGMRCYSRKAMLSLNLMGRFTYTQEVFLNLAFKGLPIAEIPIEVRGEREFGKSRVASNLWRYAWLSSLIIFRCYRDYRPMRFFGAIALVLGTLGLALGSFLGLHYLSTGAFTPHKWAGFLAGGLWALALMFLHMGLVGDMLNRHRTYLEELLFEQRMRAARERER